ncbi:hypothetical protein [Clostridium sp.]|uniref:hypothetical protein n=1 Tax=Clostridium sp. TaxID=1506 RepID=UPI001B443DAD|nr:hypothetical protein [Clostridium sp.]MBP3916011.1 hypothetical protein [Clostridium sp.]
MAKIYLKERRVEVESEDDLNHIINISYDRRTKKIHISDDYNYRREFKIGDIVTLNICDFGYVYRTSHDESEVKVYWGFCHSEWENKKDLLIIPPEYGLDLLTHTVNKNKCDYFPVTNWLALINGKGDNLNETFLFGDSDMPEVTFIEFDKVKNTLIDNKIDRNIKLYRELNRYSLYKASLFNGEKLDSWKNVFYIYDKATSKVYFGGVDTEVRKTLAILYKKDKIKFF